MSRWDGDIIFKSPDKEFLRLCGDGRILVEGRLLESEDRLVVMAFKNWLASSLVTTPNASVARAFVPPDGALTFQSGTGVSPTGRGGHVVLDSSPSGAATRNQHPIDVSCPYCSALAGASCSDDARELPVQHEGKSYHASRARRAGVRP